MGRIFNSKISVRARLHSSAQRRASGGRLPLHADYISSAVKAVWKRLGAHTTATISVEFEQASRQVAGRVVHPDGVYGGLEALFERGHPSWDLTAPCLSIS